jgi:N-acetylmuramoyl-L-alanine amidase
VLSQAWGRHRWLSAVLLALLLPGVVLALTQKNSSAAPVQKDSPSTQKKALGRAEFDKAEELRKQLEARPESKRRVADYLTIIRRYENALRLNPASGMAAESVMTTARLWEEMAAQFGDHKYVQSAAERYRFLIKEYPHSKFVSEAQGALAAAETPGKRGETPPSVKAAAKPMMEPLVEPVEKPQPGRIAQVTSIRHWATPSYTRVVIEMDAPVEYQAGRITNPDRIFFDLHGARLGPALHGQNITGDDNLLKRVRMAQNQVGIARIVLEVGQIRDYSAFLLPNPYRLVVDINGTKGEAKRVAQSEPRPEQRLDARAESKSEPGGGAAAVSRDRKPAAPSAAPPRGETGEQARDTRAAADKRASGRPASVTTAAEDKRKQPDESGIEPAAEKIDISTVASASPVGSGPVFERVAPQPPAANKQPAGIRDAAGKAAPVKSSRPPATAAGGRAPADVPAGHTARPTSTGDRSLTRALGLKIGTIVIDPGHGGHDTGTIGPGGLMEKDLVLDVAQRLGALIEERLGGDIVYTRSDDSFVPLETRTAIANQKQADLFVSIHANSSRDSKARGIETYYLNFTTDQDALEVAARENAVSEKSVHELQDLVKKITLREKLEESREFAGEVQRSLYTNMSRGNTGLRNRGVKKAPFVVLIGANMPSILAEISFVSNPTDERLLKKPDYRQKVAEALFRGVQRYANSLSGVKVAAHQPPPIE